MDKFALKVFKNLFNVKLDIVCIYSENPNRADFIFRKKNKSEIILSVHNGTFNCSCSHNKKNTSTSNCLHKKYLLTSVGELNGPTEKFVQVFLKKKKKNVSTVLSIEKGINDDCGICFEKLNAGMICCWNCNYLLHLNCLLEWRKHCIDSFGSPTKANRCIHCQNPNCYSPEEIFH